jgi:nitrite reductase (NADH) small subunit
MTLLANPAGTAIITEDLADLDQWQPVCALADLQPHRGVTALVRGRAVALFRLDPAAVDNEDHGLRVIDNVDPYADASVLSRGLVGCTEADGRPVHYVASPLRKQRFDLATGQELDGDRQVTVWPVRVTNGVVEVAAEASCWSNGPETGA